MIACLDVLVVAAGVLFYNRFLALCFDEEFARLRGVNVEIFLSPAFVPDSADGGAACLGGGHRDGDRAAYPPGCCCR